MDQGLKLSKASRLIDDRATSDVRELYASVSVKAENHEAQPSVSASAPSPADDILVGTSADDSINGLGGNDTISGLGGNDTLAGNAGADNIDGGDGNDAIYSGDVAPVFNYPGNGSAYTSPALDTGSERDTLVGGAGDDKLYAGYGDDVDGGDGLDHLSISFQGATAGVSFDLGQATQVIGGGTITNIEAVALIQGSNFGDHIDLSAEQTVAFDYPIVLGEGGDDVLIAGYNTNVLDGGDGNDILDGRHGQYLRELDGGAGDDTIYAYGLIGTSAYGGAGNDTIYAGSTARAGAGNDTIIIKTSYGASVTGDAGDDLVFGGYGADTIQGNDGNDTLRGANGNDRLIGGAGADVLIGGVGNDSLTGGADNDTFQFEQGDGKDTITDFAVGDLIKVYGYDHAQSVTQVGADVVAVFATGDQITVKNVDVATVQGGLQFAPPSDDVIVGTDDNDLLRGYGGNDTISGNGGADTLVGGTGADTVNGGDGPDTIYSGDLVPATYSFPYQGHYVSPQLDVGSEPDTLNGGAGDDTIFAGYGDNVDGGSEESYGDSLFVSFRGASTGIHFDAHLASQTIGGGTITGIEDISWVQGSDFDDYVDVGFAVESGYSAFNVVEGFGGNDTLIAGYYTGAMDGGDGNDTIDGRLSGYVETILGGSGDDTIFAPGNGQVVVDGGAGNDTIFSAGETHGGAGDDIITVGRPYFGSAEITGDEGNDVIIDGDGDDTLNGGAGDDVLTGGGGNDVFLVGDGNDTITDLASGDILNLASGLAANGITQSGSDVQIALTNGAVVTVKNTDAAAVTQALVANANDLATSADGSMIYAAGDDGSLYVVDANTGELVNSWHVGKELGGLALSPDGSFAVVTDLQPLVAHTDPNNWTNNQFTVAAYKVDLSSGHVTRYGLDVTGENYAFYDAAVLSDGTIMLSEQILPGWSGTGDTYILDPSSGTFTLQPFGGQSNVLSHSRDGQHTLIAIGNTSDGPLRIYGPGGVTASHTLTQDNDYGYNAGIQAISEDGSFTAASTIAGLNIYDSQLNHLIDLTDAHLEWQYPSVSGVAFDASGQYLFVLDSQADQIVQLSTADWSVVGEIAVGADVQQSSDYGPYGGFGNRLLVGVNARYFTVMTGNGWVEVINPNASPDLTGTSGGDDLTGTGLYDVITGLEGNDHILGGRGDDVVDGGAGNDILDGGAGSDTVAYTSAKAGVVVSLATSAPQSTGGAGTDTLSSFENLTGTAYSDTLTGSALANVIDGGTGADTMSGGAGDDVYLVRDAGDLVVESAGQGSDAVKSSVNFTLGANVENLTLTGTTALSGVGNEQANIITGNSGANILRGMAGDDTLSGSAGADKMYGGSGDDTYIVENIGDLTYENIAEGIDVVLASVSYALRANIENLILTGTAGLSGKGNDLDNAITGNGGANMLYGFGGNDTLLGGAGRDILDGGAGNDTLKGGADNDVYVVDSSSDVIVENAGQGTDYVRSSASFTLSANVERLYLTGAANIDATGNNEQNLVVGNGGANYLSGLGSNDHLYGGAGNDTIDGGAGNDYMEGGAAQDLLIGGDGRDYFVFRDGDTGATVASADEIQDFAYGDRVGLSPIDANTLENGNQAFSFLGTAAFSHTAGELRYEQDGTDTYLSGDTDGDGIADFMIKLDGLHALTSGDLLL